MFLTPTTNLLAMPMVSMTIETGTNEDWIDSIKFLVDSGEASIDNMQQLDLRGIIFEMEVRRSIPDHQVVLNATTADGSLKIGDAPNFGYLIIGINLEEMTLQQPGEYVADIIGIEQEKDINGKILHHLQRIIAQIALTIYAGVTR